MGLYLELLNLLTLGNDLNAQIDLKVNSSPNPFSDQINLAFDLPDAQYIQVSLYDNLGKLINSMDSGHKIKGTYTYIINGSNLSTGIYFVELQTPNGRFRSKIIKQ